jgi:hypothetical protein
MAKREAQIEPDIPGDLGFTLKTVPQVAGSTISKVRFADGREITYTTLAEEAMAQTLKETLAELKAIRALLEQPKGTALRELSQAGRHNPPAELT